MRGHPATSWLLLLVIPLAGCGAVPHRHATAAEIRALPRRIHFAPTGKVSTIWSGEIDGPRLIYVHGTPGDAEAWGDYLVDPLAGCTSIGLDRPGFGQSDPERAVPSLEQQAAAIEPLLSRSIRNSNDEILPLRSELEDLALGLGRITCSVFIIHGKKDGLVPYQNVGYMRDALIGVESLQVISLEDMGHFLIWTPAGAQVVREAIGRLSIDQRATRPGRARASWSRRSLAR